MLASAGWLATSVVATTNAVYETVRRFVDQTTTMRSKSPSLREIADKAWAAAEQAVSVSCHEPRFDPFDLIGAYVVPLQRVDLFGPKSHWGKYVDFEHFVYRVRYLLSTDLDEPLAELFKLSTQDLGIFLPGHHCHMAAWLAGLQGNRRFIPQLLKLIQGGDGFECPFEFGLAMQSSLVAVCAAVVLLGDASLAEAMLTAGERLRRRDNDAMRPDESSAFVLAVIAACLIAYDLRWKTEYAASFPVDCAPGRMSNAHHKLNRILAVSEVLTLGHCFDEPDELRAMLQEFNSTSTPAQFQAAGVLRPPVLRPYRASDYDGTVQRRAHQFRQDSAYWKSIGRTMPHVLAERFNAVQPRLWFARTESKHDLAVTNHVHNWLLGATADTFWMNAATRAATDPLDLLSALEQDLHYRLPADSVDLMYESLGKLLAFDATLTEEHAFALLLRSNSHDDKARGLLEKANVIKQLQCRLEHYPMVKMPAGWVPRYHDIRLGGPTKASNHTM
jgi:hypothetical protein